MKIITRFLTLTLLLAGFLIIPTSEARARIYVRMAPPPVIVEQATVAPRAGYVWQPGYHRWSGRSYVWTAGVWARPPHRNAAWVPGHWANERRGHYWVAGHWR
jgi:hypothetical protein